MINNIKIVIVSAGRAQSVLTNVNNAILCVPENEKKEYKKYNDYDIITHPKLKNLAAKRNFILNKYKSVFMLDDDLVTFERVYQSKEQVLNKDETYKRIQELYYQSLSVNAKLFGFSEDPSPIHYNPYKPFMMKGISGGGAYGIIDGGKLYFTEKTTACDSHWITLLNTYYNRYSLIDTRFCFRPKDTFKGNGGQSMKRTLESEKRDTLFLRKMFGNSVILKQPKKDAKQNHQYQRIIKTKW